MRLRSCCFGLCLVASLGMSSAGAQQVVPAAPEVKPAPTTLELIEDLRILSIVNTLQLTRDQSSQLAAVAAAAKDGLAAIDAEAKKALDRQRERLVAAREKALRGEATPATTDSQLAAATQAAEATRAQKTELLILSLHSRVRRILAVQQAQHIENELAPTADQPWRRYSRMVTGPTPPAAARPGSGGGSRLPVDPGSWLKELRDLRIDSAEGDPAYEVEDFAKKVTRGLPQNAPHFEQTFTQARALASQVLTMPPDVFGQREWQLARMVAKQQLESRNQQRILEGKPIETFDPYRWFVEQVVLSPRAAADFNDRAAAR